MKKLNLNRFSGFSFIFLILAIINFSYADALDYAVLSLSARIESLGGSAAARDNGLGGAYINPASLGGLGKNEILFSSGQIFEDYMRYSLGWACPLADKNTLGVSYTTAEISGLQRIEKVGERPVVLYEDSSRYNVLICTYVQDFLEKLTLGANLKYYTRSVFGESASALGLDVGLQYALMKNFDFGVSFRNVNAPVMNWTTGAQDELDRDARIGLAYELQLFCPLILSVDNIYAAEKTQTNYGLEFWLWPDTLALRAGLAEELLNLGVGFNWAGFGLDYAYAKQEDLGNSHKISLDWLF